MARHQAESTQRSGMIRAFVSNALCVTAHVLNGKSQLVLDFQQRQFAGKRQLYVRTSLIRAHADTSSVLGMKGSTRVRVTSNRSMEPTKREGFDHGRHSSGIVGKEPGSCTAR